MISARGTRTFLTAWLLGMCLCMVAGSGCDSTTATTLGLTVIDSENETQPDDTTDGGNSTSDDPAPSNAYCDAVAEWDPAWVDFENEVLELVNQNRAAGADCGSSGVFGPAGPLSTDGALRCAARNHSRDMATRSYFSHTSPDGDGPGERLSQADYQPSTWAENIAWGYASPAAVVAGWMSSPGHCANIMNAGLTETGVGYYEGNQWTQTFGRL